MMELVTARLVLREFVAADWEAVLAYHQNPLYLRYYADTGRTPHQARAFVRMFLEQQAADPRIKFQLAVTLKETGALIGNCGVRLKQAGEICGDIGYELNPDYWGRGLATEAARAIVHFGFTELGLHRIWSWCVADNVGSARVLEKVGFKLEGRMRDHEYFKGRFWDTLIYGMLRSEWADQ